MGRTRLDISKVDGTVYTPVTDAFNAYTIIFGYDGPLNYFFIEVHPLGARDDPLWDSTFSYKGDPFKDHKTPQAVIASAMGWGLQLSGAVVNLITQAMEAEKAGYVDRRSPGMKDFQSRLSRDLGFADANEED